MAGNERAKWTSWWEYMLSCIGSVVGLGNIWRFPYLCYKNGGGAFLIPYFIFILLSGVPLVYMEMSMCQFANLGPGRVWEMCPLFKGVGIGQVVVTTVVSIYYTVIIGWAAYYFVMSCRSSLPWTTCDNEWNTPQCFVRVGVDINSSGHDSTTSVWKLTTESIKHRTPTEEFWDHSVLERSSGIEEIGVIRWELLLCLLSAWVAAYLSLLKGIKSSGKVMYLAATLPYLFLTILLIRGLLLPGATDGLIYYLLPNWERLLDFSVWVDAAIQALFSAGIGFGVVSTLASFNDFHNNTTRDAIILVLIDAFTSWFAGMVIFTTLGFMANQSGLKIKDVVAQGPGIAFMVYPEALSQLPLPQLWCAIFFILLFTVGLDSQIVHMQTITTAITDNFPQLGKKQLLVNTITSIPLFLIGILCVTQGGVYVLQLLDWYCGGIVLALACFETIGVAWVYGMERFCDDLELMLGRQPLTLWKILWKFINPGVIGVLMIVAVVNLENVTYGDMKYPDWSIGVGWIIAMLPISPLPIFMIYQIVRHKGSIRTRLRRCIQPSRGWRPAKEELVDLYDKQHHWDNVDGENMQQMKPLV